MNYREEVAKAVEAALEKNVIREMNALLCELSEDPELSREERYTQQQRLRLAVFKHGSEKLQLAEQRRNWLTRGGIIRFVMTQSIPQHFAHTRSTPFWNRESVPEALLTHHNTSPSVYGRLSVMCGAVKYFGFASENDTAHEMEVTINAGQFGISPPQYWHRIALLTEDTRFNIDFFCRSECGLKR